MRVLIAGGIFRESSAAQHQKQPTPEIVLAEGLRELGVTVETVPLEAINRIARPRDFDLVHVHHQSKAALICAGSPMRSVPMVFTQHAAIPKHTGRRLALRLVLRRSDAVICLSKAERVEKQRLIGTGSKAQLVTIPNGIRPFGAIPDGPRSKPRQGFSLLYVGGLKPVKQVDRILFALKGLPRSFRVRLVYHDSTLESELRELAVTLNVIDRVAFIGQRSGQALEKEYLEADALILPSRSESLPSCVTEALSMGLPVLVANCEGTPEQVGDAGILLDPSPRVSLEPAVKAMWTDYARYAHSAYASIGRITGNYSVEQMISAHHDLYGRLI